MKQHAIPQNVLDVEFKLFGFFTIKEFVYLAVGLGSSGLVFYSWTNTLANRPGLPGLVAIPIGIVLLLLTIFIVFIPVNDMKADKFLSNYIRAILAPTLRIWRNRKFDEKLDQITKARAAQVTTGTMDRSVTDSLDPDSPASIKSVGLAKELDTFESKQTQAIDAEEQERLNQLEAQISQIDPATQNNKTEDQVSIERSEKVDQYETSTATESINSVLDSSTKISLEAESTPPSQSNVQATQRVIIVNQDTITKYQLDLANFSPNANTLNFFVCDINNTPQTNVEYLIALNGKLVTEGKTDGNGWLTSSELPDGNYHVVFKSVNMDIPIVDFDLSKDSSRPIKVLALNRNG